MCKRTLLNFLLQITLNIFTSREKLSLLLDFSALTSLIKFFIFFCLESICTALLSWLCSYLVKNLLPPFVFFFFLECKVVTPVLLEVQWHSELSCFCGSFQFISHAGIPFSSYWHCCRKFQSNVAYEWCCSSICQHRIYELWDFDFLFRISDHVTYTFFGINKCKSCNTFMVNVFDGPQKCVCCTLEVNGCHPAVWAIRVCYHTSDFIIYIPHYLGFMWCLEKILEK